MFRSIPFGEMTKNVPPIDKDKRTKKARARGIQYRSNDTPDPLNLMYRMAEASELRDTDLGVRREAMAGGMGDSHPHP